VNNLQTISLITPPGAVAIGWLLGGETFSLWQLVGGALVLFGVWMIFRKGEAAANAESQLNPAVPRP
jgi:drug/metabolite transporter (DMT)-like permease